MNKKKVNVYIDGFNLYYAIQNKIRDTNSGRTKEFQRCDFRSLFTHFLEDDEILHQVYFFSAYRIGDKQGKKRHKTYVEALTISGVKVILGNYQRKNNKYIQGKNIIKSILCDGGLVEEEKCKKILKMLEYKTFEEKETDVKIANQILQDAFTNSYDHAYIVSGDSDITPSILSIRNLMKQKILNNKTFSSVLIPGTKGHKIRKLCDHRHEITTKMMKSSMLPHIVSKKGGDDIQMPLSWLKN